MSVERGSFGRYQHAPVEPAVDIGRIESVMVLIDGWSPDTTFEERSSVPDNLTAPVLDGVVLPPVPPPVPVPPAGVPQ